MYVFSPTRQFFRIEPRQGTLLAGRMRCQIDVYDSSIANFTIKYITIIQHQKQTLPTGEPIPIPLKR